MTQLIGSHPRKWLILALVLAAEIMDLLDGTIVNVAAPTVQDLHAGDSALQWITGGYALTFAVGLVTGARLGDVVGRRRMFVIGAWGFTAASLLCATSVDTPMLISFRLLQGLAAAMLIPQGLGILKAAFAPDEQASAFSIFGPVIGLAAVIGPILGGVLVQADLFGTGWRLVFFINLPIGLIAAIGGSRVFPESRVVPAPAIDVVGTVLLAGFAGLLTYPLVQGRQAGWPAWTYVMILLSFVSLAGLVFWTRRRQRAGLDPVVEPHIFSYRGFSAGVTMIFIFFGGMIGVLLTITLFLQIGEHFSAIRAGLTLGPFAFGTALGAGLGAALLAPRLGRKTLHLGALIQAGGLAWLLAILHSQQLTTSTFELFPALLVWGIGLGFLVAPLFDFVLAAVQDSEVGSASGTLNALQQLGGAIGVAVIGTVFFSTVTRSGYVSGLQHALAIQLCLVPVLILLTFLLPQKPREEVQAPAAGGLGRELVTAG